MEYVWCECGCVSGYEELKRREEREQTKRRKSVKEKEMFSFGQRNHLPFENFLFIISTHPQTYSPSFSFSLFLSHTSSNTYTLCLTHFIKHTFFLSLFLFLGLCWIIQFFVLFQSSELSWQKLRTSFSFLSFLLSPSEF